ncbi:LacI family transcriptional regulator, partial [Tritonibacter sp. SIMBA_163]
IGCLVPTLANPAFAQAAQRVHEAPCKTGYPLLSASSNYDGAADCADIPPLLDKGGARPVLTMLPPERRAAPDPARARGT